jgi:hypothetical protein
LFLAISLLIGVATAADVENIVANPDFDADTTDWSLGGLSDGAAGELIAETADTAVGGVSGTVMHAKIDGLGDDAWEPEIHSPPFDVEEGKIYTVSFWAKTEAGKERPLLVKFEQLDLWGGPSIVLEDPITDDWTEFHYSPEMTMSSPPQVVIHITFEGVTEDVWFDHFRVYEGDYVAEEFGTGTAIEPIGKLGATWGTIKSK